MMYTQKEFPDTHAPHLHDWRSTSKVVWICSLVLLPVVVWSIALYRWAAITVWLSSVASALLTQLVVDGLFKRFTLRDGTALLTGLLVASAMPPAISPFIPAAASAFAILVVKTLFGGLGGNWMNPSLAGIAFAYANWPVAMREYVLPTVLAGVDGLSSSTPLAFAHGLAGSGQARVMDAIRQAGYPLSGMDESLTGFLNDSIFSHLGARLPEGYIDLAVGFKSGALGESALFAVILASIILLALRLVKYEIPLAILGSFAILAGIFGTGLPGEFIMGGDVLYALSGGGLILAAFFMATDPVSSPVDRKIATIYGLAIGVLCFVFRRWGNHTEGIAYAILIMNVLTPTLERRLEPLLGPKPARTSV
ncbi:MAG: electron transporter RnfD [Spirochaetales bacterium]|nr:MAG: electron transporter RnfD [Spirochaetales bacterium]